MKHEFKKNSVLRRLLRLGSSFALSLPASWVSEWEFVVVERRDREIVIRPVNLQVIED